MIAARARGVGHRLSSRCRPEVSEAAVAGTCSTGSARRWPHAAPALPHQRSRWRSASAVRPRRPCLAAPTAIGAPAAALANGTLVHALDFDDTHAGGLVHATAVVLPAALAVGEQVGASGADVLAAAVVGYETACRVAAAAPHRVPRARPARNDGRRHVLVRPRRSAAAGPRRRPRDRTPSASPGSQSGGLLAFLGTGASTKQLHPGFASHAGILAARLAAAGATGPATVFDGPHGVFDALADGAVDAGTITRGLGDAWETTRIGIKPYPACQLSHADPGTRSPRPPGGPVSTAGEVVAVHARVHPDSAAIVCARPRTWPRPGRRTLRSSRCPGAWRR